MEIERIPNRKNVCDENNQGEIIQITKLRVWIKFMPQATSSC